MPTILLEDPASGESSILLSVWATMLFPRDKESDKRRRWLAAATLSVCARNPENERPAVSRLWLADLWELDRSPRRVFDDGNERIGRAVVAGLLLHYLLLLYTHHRRHFSIERAIAVLQEKAASKPGLPVSDSSIQKAWADFKPASHFWAASVAMGSTGKSELPWFSDAATYMEFLGLAEGFREEAESANLLKPGQAWQLPANADVQPTPIRRIPVLPAELLAFLDSQFPD